MAHVIIGVTGGVAAYKSGEIVRQLIKGGDEVTPILTRDAERFVGRRTFEALARRASPDDLYPHLADADLLLIAPLSANTLAKLATGLADNILTQLALAFPGPIVVAPAMNTRMWEHPATQESVSRLRERGVTLIGPETGELAEGEFGAGRMSEPLEIVARVRAQLGAKQSGPLAGRSVVVTAGGTREALDTVRYLGNRSTGRMGFAVAAEAARRGASVTLIAANVSLPAPAGVELVPVVSAAELATETLSRGDAEIVIMAAAVADYRPVSAEQHKRKKTDANWNVELERTQDVLHELGGRRSDGQILVGFAADEGEEGLAHARDKRQRKNVNLIVFNDVSRSDVGFEVAENELVLIGPDGERHVSKRSKEACAQAILDDVALLLRPA
ncbi:MAG: bifunctional phosphopantothenoylcysteine decarboxylase/phosphopantothenate--cysteine ligase CoaBC [Gaiellaceae bacterium]